MPKESKFSDQIKRKLSSDWFYQRIETTTGPGVPDIFLFNVRLGRCVWIEVKSMDYPAIRPFQYAWFHRAWAKGLRAVLLNSNPKTSMIEGWNYVFTVSKTGRPIEPPHFSVDKSTFFSNPELFLLQ